MSGLDATDEVFDLKTAKPNESAPTDICAKAVPKRAGPGDASTASVAVDGVDTSSAQDIPDVNADRLTPTATDERQPCQTSSAIPASRSWAETLSAFPRANGDWADESEDEEMLHRAREAREHFEFVTNQVIGTKSELTGNSAVKSSFSDDSSDDDEMPQVTAGTSTSAANDAAFERHRIALYSQWLLENKNSPVPRHVYPIGDDLERHREPGSVRKVNDPPLPPSLLGPSQRTEVEGITFQGFDGDWTGETSTPHDLERGSNEPEISGPADPGLTVSQTNSSSESVADDEVESKAASTSDKDTACTTHPIPEGQAVKSLPSASGTSDLHLHEDDDHDPPSPTASDASSVDSVTQKSKREVREAAQAWEAGLQRPQDGYQEREQSQAFLEKQRLELLVENSRMRGRIPSPQRSVPSEEYLRRLEQKYHSVKRDYEYANDSATGWFHSSEDWRREAERLKEEVRAEHDLYVDTRCELENEKHLKQDALAEIEKVDQQCRDLEARCTHLADAGRSVKYKLDQERERADRDSKQAFQWRALEQGLLKEKGVYVDENTQTDCEITQHVPEIEAAKELRVTDSQVQDTYAQRGGGRSVVCPSLPPGYELFRQRRWKQREAEVQRSDAWKDGVERCERERSTQEEEDARLRKAQEAYWRDLLGIRDDKELPYVPVGDRWKHLLLA